MKAREGIESVDEDEFRPALVAHVGALIVKACVTDHTGNFGGQAFIGVKEAFTVGVFGVDVGGSKRG